jgi:hypothetical protein
VRPLAFAATTRIDSTHAGAASASTPGAQLHQDVGLYLPHALGPRRKGKRMRTIDGPFPHGRRFRIRIRPKGKGASYQSFATEEEACKELKKLRRRRPGTPG